MTRRKGRRLADLTARDIDEMRPFHDEAELDRYDREQMGREPADDPPRVDPDFRMWLADADDFRAA